MSKSSKTLKVAARPEQTCSICMIRAINCKTVECNHQFCYRCLSKWGRRKGNCPLCRSKVRRVHYKKAIIEPEYLKYFDDSGSVILPNNQINFEMPLPQPERVEPERPQSTSVGSYSILFPMFTSAPGMAFFSPFQLLMLSNNTV